MKARGVRWLFVLVGLAVASAARGAGAPLVLVGRIDTPIQPASASYLKKLIRSAEDEHASLVVVSLSTPGGLLTSTREMTTAILLSKVPVATFVSPAGSQAASAGFFLLLAGDVAAMAPGTNTGAAHPVGSEGQDLPKVLNEKAEQDARAFIRSIAGQRGKNADKAETTVTQSASFTEKEAKGAGLVDVIARDVPDLLAQIEGRTIRREGSPAIVLALAGARVVPREMSQLEKLLGVVSHPNVAYILFLLGLVGLYFELSSPGAILPGIVGGIAMLLALYAFSVLPVNLAGLALIFFAILLFVAEVKVVSHGLLAVGGAIALVAGSTLLFAGRGDAAGYRVDLSIILPGLAVTLLIVAFLTWNTIRLRRLPVTTGTPGLIGQEARVVRGFAGPEGRGTVLVNGEYWDADGAPGAQPGEPVRILRVDNFTLRVERRAS
ncbi:MAG: NfeD family protein [Thermoanaerobaculia bacterium]